MVEEQSEAAHFHQVVLNPPVGREALTDPPSELGTELVDIERKMFAIGNNKTIVL